MRHGQVTVGTSPTLIIDANGRNEVGIVNHGTVDVFTGGPAVTVSTGALLSGTKGHAVNFNTSEAIYGIVVSGSALVSFTET